MGLTFGISLGTQMVFSGPDEIIDIARTLEALEFDDVWFSERVCSAALDPLGALGFIAGSTKRLGFGTSVLVVPGRNPVLLAKQLSTIDFLSKGRLRLAVGLGGVNAAEQQAFGVRRDERAPWFEEALPLIRRLWAEDDVSHNGKRFVLDSVTVLPRATQTRLPVWLGGSSPSEYRRAGRLGDGWLGSMLTATEFRAGRIAAESAAAESRGEHARSQFGAGFVLRYSMGDRGPDVRQLIARHRPNATISDLVPSGRAELSEMLEDLQEAGASRFILVPGDQPQSWEEELHWLSETIRPIRAKGLHGE